MIASRNIFAEAKKTLSLTISFITFHNLSIELKFGLYGGNHDLARDWQNRQSAQGFNIDIAYVDISAFNDCEKLTDLVIERYGKIDVLVNNAGVTSDATLKKMTF